MNDPFNSPWAAFAGQAATNLTNMGAGRPVVSPIQAYQTQVMRRAQMNQRMKEFEEARRLRDLQIQKAERDLAAQPERKILKDAAGRQRYADDGSYVFEDVQMPESGIFEGSGVDAQAYNIVFGGNYSPESPEYRAAFSRLYTPRTTIDNITGQAVEIRPAVPAGVIPPPGFGQQSPGQPTVTPKELSASQIDNFGYLQSSARAHTDLLELEDAGIAIPENAVEFYLDPDNKFGRIAVRNMMTQEQRRYMDLIMDSGMVKLRDESGAALGKEEIANQLKQLIVYTGDSPEQVKDKRTRRLEAINKYEKGTRLSPEEKQALDELREIWASGPGESVTAPAVPAEDDDPDNW